MCSGKMWWNYSRKYSWLLCKR